MVEQTEKITFFIFWGKHPGTIKITVVEDMNFKAEKNM